jgi:hypothetical protein
MRRTAAIFVATAAAASLMGGAFASAAGTVPTVSNPSFSPKKFCAKRSKHCHHPGTELSFTLSSPATVRGDIRPRYYYAGSFVEFVKRFPAGRNEIYIRDSRLKPGTWTMRIQPTNDVGSGGIAVADVKVVKRDHR